jgi:hypothetical protein
MTLEDPTTIDLVATNPQRQLELIIVDAGITSDPQARMQRLTAKLRFYSDYLRSSEFANDHGQLDTNQVQITVFCRTQPTPPMLALRQVSPSGNHAAAIAVKFVMSDGSELDSEGESVFPEANQDSVLPRLVRPEFLLALSDVVEIPRRALGDTGLWIVYVLDSEHAVEYVTRATAKKLSLDDDALHACALTNLSRKLPVEAIRQLLAEGRKAFIQSEDTFDAARILVIPKYLAEGEEIAAAIPDRDALLIGPVPSDGDWSIFSKLAQTPGSDSVLLDKPVRVTSAGIDLAALPKN